MALALVGVPSLLLAHLAAAEARRLADRAQRYRELEHEGLERLTRYDAFPEFAATANHMVLSDGIRISEERLLACELRLIRASRGV